jgi:hypothetical protein
MRMRGAFGTAVALTLGALTPQEARAEAPHGASLWAAWEAPPECPQEAAFVAQIESFLGTPLNARGDRQLEIVGRVRTEEARGFVVKLRVHASRRTQERELAHRDCSELTEAAALIVALAIDPQVVVQKPIPKPALPPATEAAVTPPSRETAVVRAEPAAAIPRRAAPATAASSVATPPVAEPATLRYSLSALGLFGTGVLPDVGAGTGIHATLGPRRFRMAAEGAYWLSRFRALEGRAGAGVELGTWSVALRGCGIPVTGDVTLSLCVGPVVGDMYGTGSGLSNPRTVHDHWSAVSAETSVALASRAGVMTLVGLEVQKTLETPRFGAIVDGREHQLFEANAWVVNAFIGLGVFR